MGVDKRRQWSCPMSTVLPVVRYLIICENMSTPPGRPNYWIIEGLVSSITSNEVPPHPLLFRELRFLVQMTEYRGQGTCRLEIQHADSGQLILRTPDRLLPPNSDPLAVLGVSFRVQDILFPQAGLYTAN